MTVKYAYSRALPREEQETCIIADRESVMAYTTNPAHWIALKRRAKRLGGTIDYTHTLGKRELGGQITFPADAFSPARMGLRASPRKEKKNV